MKKPRKVYPKTFLPPGLLRPRAARLMAFVNSSRAEAVWPGIPAARVGKLRDALRAYLQTLTTEPWTSRKSTQARQQALVPVAMACGMWRRRVTVTGRFWPDDHGQQHLMPLRFAPPASELLVAAGDLLNPGTTVRVRRCECELHAGRCDAFLINDYAPGKGKGDKPHCLPEHRLLPRERLALNQHPSKRTELLEQFRNDLAAREAARALRRT